jgi:hypothetical protein
LRLDPAEPHFLIAISLAPGKIKWTIFVSYYYNYYTWNAKNTITYDHISSIPCVVVVLECINKKV